MFVTVGMVIAIKYFTGEKWNAIAKLGKKETQGEA